MTIEPAATPLAAFPTPTARLIGWLRNGGWRPIALGGLGALAAGTYAHFIGCRVGGCALLSSVRSASLAGALFGLILGWPSRSPSPAFAPPPQKRP